ncbi:MAG: TolC family protein [Dysgonamonadaceae bacterium]|jgi:outer membrane protein TolC|nr:TolC family protein [Dysgonamonadaceae bacterium]
MKHLCKLWIVANLLSFPAIYGQEIYNLQRCLEIGLERNYDIRIIRNDQQITDNNRSIGNAGYLPTLNLTTGYAGSLYDREQKTSTGERINSTGVQDRSVSADLGLEWTIFDGLKIQTNYKRLRELQQIGALNTRLVIEDFISQLSAEYYNFVQQKIRLKNLQAAVSLSRERLRIVEERYNIGSMSRLDLQQAKVDFNADSSKLIKQFEVLQTSRIHLNEMMALDDVNKRLIIRDSVIIPNALLDLEILRDKTLTTNAGLLLSQKNQTLSSLDYQVIKSRNYPYLRLNAGYGYGLNKYGVGTYKQQENIGLTYGLTLGFTIFDGMNRRREQQNAKLQIQNRQLEYERLELGLKSDLSNIWIAYRNNLELLNLERQNLSTAKENYEIAIERYKLGDLSGIELREAQNSLLEAEERLLLAEYNTKICEISLMQISGQAKEYVGTEYFFDKPQP